MASRDDRALILFAWRRPPPPYFLGGAEISQALLAGALRRAGYRVRYLGSFDEPWAGGRRIRDEVLRWLRQREIETSPSNEGGEVSYVWEGVACRMCAGERLAEALVEELDREPAIAISSQEGCAQLLRDCQAAGARTLGWVHSVSETGLLAAAAAPAELLCVSRFVQERAFRTFGRRGRLFYPPFSPIADDAAGSRSGHLTMVNPIPEKGGELFVELARALPDREFLAVDGWYTASLPRLPNLQRLARPAPMAQVWEGTSLLLAPSTVEEGFGRVCVEAGQRGIPSLASNRGGLPEAVGPGGTVLAANAGTSAWMEAIEAAERPRAHRSLGEAARIHARRFERDVVSELAHAGILA